MYISITQEKERNVYMINNILDEEYYQGYYKDIVNSTGIGINYEEFVKKSINFFENREKTANLNLNTFRELLEDSINVYNIYNIREILPTP